MSLAEFAGMGYLRFYNILDISYLVFLKNSAMRKYKIMLREESHLKVNLNGVWEDGEDGA